MYPVNEIGAKSRGKRRRRTTRARAIWLIVHIPLNHFSQAHFQTTGKTPGVQLLYPTLFPPILIHDTFCLSSPTNVFSAFLLEEKIGEIREQYMPFPFVCQPKLQLQKKVCINNASSSFFCDGGGPNVVGAKGGN